MILSEDENPPRFSLRDQIRCIEREIVRRRRTYPRDVYTGKMTAPVMEKEIALMEQVLRTMQAMINDGK